MCIHTFANKWQMPFIYWCTERLQVQVQVQVQNFIQKTFSGYTQVAYEKKEEQ